MAHPRIEKTNAARLLDRAKIAYELIPYRVDEEHLAATHVAEHAVLFCPIRKLRRECASGLILFIDKYTLLW